MSLQTKLEQFKSSWQHRAGADVATLIDTDNQLLQQILDNKRHVTAGQIFPRHILTDSFGKKFDLGAELSGKTTVITFYRGGWCPYCNLELREYQALLAEFNYAGAQVIAISFEKPEVSLLTGEQNSLHFPLLADEQGLLAKELGILFQLTNEVKALYQKFGHDLPARNNDTDWLLPVPATYLVGPTGRISFAKVAADYRTRAEPKHLLELVKATQSSISFEGR
jgi:peroxiredoxin